MSKVIKKLRKMCILKPEPFCHLVINSHLHYSFNMQTIQSENCLLGPKKSVPSLIRSCFNFVLSVSTWEYESFF